MDLVVGNLLDNARKYADPESVVMLKIETNAVHKNPRSDEDFELCIAVLSFGPVLSSVQLAHVFEKYWRDDQHADIGGSGMGLSLVRHIMQLHGGSAEVQQLPGRWTNFSLRFPIHRT